VTTSAEVTRQAAKVKHDQEAMTKQKVKTQAPEGSGSFWNQPITRRL